MSLRNIVIAAVMVALAIAAPQALALSEGAFRKSTAVESNGTSSNRSW
jgi:hypothetical protein